MTVVREIDGGPHPLLITFQNDPPTVVSECRLLSDKKQTTAAVATPSTLYVGGESDAGFNRNFLVARNRRTGKVRIVEVGRATLKAHLGDAAHLLPPTQTNPTQAPTVAEKFGSKRHKRYYEQTNKSNVDVDAVKEHLHAAVEGVKIDPSQLIANVQANSDSLTQYAPKADRTVSDPRKVYSLADMFSPETLTVLRANADSFFDTKQESYEADEFVKRVVVAKARTEDAMAAALAADCLLKFLKERYDTVCRRDYRICTFSDALDDELASQFLVENRGGAKNKTRSRPQAMKDKTACHVLVLLLLACDCEVPDVEALRASLGLPSAKFVQLVKVVGARIVGSSLVLKVPLAAPPTVRGKRGRK